MELSRRCLICTASITIGHGGIDACRACSSFYKRTVLAGKRYPCRQGNGGCTFRKHQRFACRSCRFNQCANLGMVVDHLGIVSMPTPESPPHIPLPNALPEPFAECSTNDAFLSTILTVYRESCVRRRAQELHFAKAFDLSKSSHPTEQYFVSNVRHNFESYRVLVTESLPLIRIFYPNMDEFALASKIALFKCFIKFSVVENYYLTQRDWRHTTQFVVSLITCFDLSNASEWVTDGDNVQRKTDLIQFLTRYAAEYVTFLMSIRKSESISDMELSALIALSFSDLDATQEVPESLLREADSLRAKVFDELSRYYRNELQLADYSSNLGLLMTIFHTMSEASTVLAEELRTYSYLFGVYSTDVIVRDVFIQ